MTDYKDDVASGEEEEDKEEKEIVHQLMEVKSIASSIDPPMEEWSSLKLAQDIMKQQRIDLEKSSLKVESGEVCAKYIRQSDSSILLHPYYKYPSIKDPGIDEALSRSYPLKNYPVDGVELYFDTCKEMNQAPVRIFYTNLFKSTIDLSYYSVNPYGVRAMAIALENNNLVRTLNFTENFLNDDACFHLGDLLMKNETLNELILDGCRIGPSGIRRILSGLAKNQTLKVLNVSRNNLDDEGATCIGGAFKGGLNISKLYLSYNNIGNEGALALAEGFEEDNQLSLLDISWNNFSNIKGLCQILDILKESTHLQTLNLSWNSLAGKVIGNSIVKIFLAINLAHLDLSNNKLQGEVIASIAKVLPKAKKLVTLNLSNNPMTVNDAITILRPLLRATVKVKKLLMENVTVNSKFINLLEKVKKCNFRQNAVITHGRVILDIICNGPDFRDIILNRLERLCRQARPRVDIALIVYRLVKDGTTIIDSKSMEVTLKDLKVSIDGSFVSGMIDAFPGPVLKRERYLNLELVAEYIKRKWPDRKLPPTPPPEPEPIPQETNKGNPQMTKKGNPQLKKGKK